MRAASVRFRIADAATLPSHLDRRAGPTQFDARQLFLHPLSKHARWVEKHGIFSNEEFSTQGDGDAEEVEIIQGEILKHYSVADELSKWAKLKEDGHVSDEEFDRAREKLLKRA